MLNSKEQFRVLPEHVTMLSNAYVRWDDSESGAPAVDSKRPYGSKNIQRSLIKLLQIAPDLPGLTQEDLNYDDEDTLYKAETLKRLWQLHLETEDVLQIVLHTGTLLPGLYEREGYAGRWQRVAD